MFYRHLKQKCLLNCSFELWKVNISYCADFTSIIGVPVDPQNGCDWSR